MSKENTVVVIGSGGAESALVKKYGQSPHVDRIIAIPGNDMMQELVPGKVVETYPRFKISQTNEIVNFLTPRSSEISFVDTRDERAIANGISNKLLENKIRSCSPNWQSGRLESDKAFTRDLMQDLVVRQPVYDKIHFKNGNVQRSHNEIVNRYGERQSFVKTNGLASGKAVIGAKNSEEIEMAIEQLRRDFPEATEKIILERAVAGEELSAFAICAGGEYRILGYAQVHKRVFDNDEDPNTGGMGAISNPSLSNNLSLTEGIKETYQKTVNNRRKRGHGYSVKGILYQGVMAVEEEGNLVPYFLEYNSRWGDPEAQVLLPGLALDLFELNDAIADNYLPDLNFTNDGKVRVAVVGASKEYPGDFSPVHGHEIIGFDEARKINGVTIFGAGVRKEEDKYYANSGRLFSAVAEGNDAPEAIDRVYEAMEHIRIYDNEGINLIHFRKDIGQREIKKLENKF